jgi:ABC-type phosphate transport system substrate-binding protein
MCAAISNGTTCLYGIAGLINNLFVQSYSLSSSFNNEAMVISEAGLTVTHRLDDRKSEITIEGIAKTSAIPQLGANLSFTVNTVSAYPSGTASATFAGVITKVDDKGSSQGFTSVSITAVDFEGISYS